MPIKSPWQAAAFSPVHVPEAEALAEGGSESKLVHFVARSSRAHACSTVRVGSAVAALPSDSLANEVDIVMRGLRSTHVAMGDAPVKLAADGVVVDPDAMVTVGMQRTLLPHPTRDATMASTADVPARTRRPRRRRQRVVGLSRSRSTQGRLEVGRAGRGRHRGSVEANNGGGASRFTMSRGRLAPWGNGVG